MKTEKLENSHSGIESLPIGEKIAWWAMAAMIFYLVFIDK